MKTSEIRNELHEKIERMDAGKLRALQNFVAHLLKDQPKKKKRVGGQLKGKIHFAEDWDAQETNEEIARTFGISD